MAEQNNEAQKPPVILRYIGNGAYFTGYPACDLTEADLATSGFSAEQLLALTIGLDTETQQAPRLFERVTQTPVIAFEPQHNDEDNEVSNG